MVGFVVVDVGLAIIATQSMSGLGAGVRSRPKEGEVVYEGRKFKLEKAGRYDYLPYTMQPYGTNGLLCPVLVQTTAGDAEGVNGDFEDPSGSGRGDKDPPQRDPSALGSLM